MLRATDRLFGAFAESVSGSKFFMLLRRVMVRVVVAPALALCGSSVGAVALRVKVNVAIADWLLVPSSATNATACGPFAERSVGNVGVNE